MTASYPSAIKSFSTKVTGDTYIDDFVNDLQDEVTAIETELGANFTALGATVAESDQAILFQRIFS